jgi:hypothetical protein
MRVRCNLEEISSATLSASIAIKDVDVSPNVAEKGRLLATFANDGRAQSVKKNSMVI